MLNIYKLVTTQLKTLNIPAYADLFKKKEKKLY